MDNKIKWVKRLYLYMFSAAGLLLLIIGSVGIINLGLRALIFTKADKIVIYPAPPKLINSEDNKSVENINVEEYEKKNIKYQKDEIIKRRQKQAASNIAMILVGLPLFLYHWRLSRKET